METDRALRLLVDATPSMAYRSEGSPGAKLAFASLIAAALARISLSAGDPVALDWLGGTARSLPAMGGKEAFSRMTAALESVRAAESFSSDGNAVDRALAPIARHARRGSVIVLLSDLIDLPDGTLDRFAALATRGRTALAVRVLDPMEATFPFKGPVRLRATESGSVTEADAARVRRAYLENLETIATSWNDRLVAHGGALVRATTTDDPVAILRSILLAIRRGRP
jgi:hypothetical protein